MLLESASLHRRLSSSITPRSRIVAGVSVLLVACIALLLIIEARVYSRSYLSLTSSKVEVLREGDVIITPPKSSETLAILRAHSSSDSRYCFSYPYGGLTNQFYVLLKTLYLAKITDRVAVLPDFSPVHGESGHDALSTFFDMPRFTNLSGVQVLEWSKLEEEFTHVQSEQELGCWTWAPEIDNSHPLNSIPTKVHYWPTPPWVSPSDHWWAETTFSALQVLSTSSQDDWLDQVSLQHPDLSQPPTLPRQPPPRPQDDLLCFDNLFWVAPYRFSKGEVVHDYNMEELIETDPVWSTIGVHLHFNAHVDEVVAKMLVELGLGTTLYIGVHIRRGDFVGWGRVPQDPNESLADYRVAVGEMQKKVEANGHKDVKVVFTTDSKEEDFIAATVLEGWILVDHVLLKTEESYGTWWPAMCDAAILSKSIGFVGTRSSTFSFVATRRVESWGGNPTVIV